MYELNLSEMTDKEFTISSFSVTDKTIFPPEPYVCEKGMVLRDRFFYVVKGKIRFVTEDGQELSFSAGDIVYLPYDVTYRSRWDTAESGKHISLNFVLRTPDGKIYSPGNGICLLLKDQKNEFFNLFTKLHRKWITGSYGYKFECRSMFYDILYRAAVNTRRTLLKSSRNNIYKAILYLENNYISDISSAELAEMIHVKECMFRRAFKSEKGMSPVQYRNMLRLKKAKEMLASGEFSVLETAVTVHFDDPGYFSKLFKRRYHVSPSECIPKVRRREE